MGLALEGIRVQNFRSLSHYELTGLTGGIALTGSNDASKSTTVDALLLLPGGRMHEYGDLPSWVSPDIMNPDDVEVVVEYNFRLRAKFTDLWRAPGVRSALARYHDQNLERAESGSEGGAIAGLLDEYRRSTYAIHRGGPPADQVVQSWYELVKQEALEHQRKPFSAFYYSGGEHRRDIKAVLNAATHLRVRYELSHGQGPHTEISLLEDSEVIVPPEGFFNWFRSQRLVDEFTFAYAILGTFVAGVGAEVFSGRSTGEGIRLESDGSNPQDHVLYVMASEPDRLARVRASFQRLFDVNLVFRSDPSGEGAPPPGGARHH